jgi:DNA-binding MarR family transcriptional regulator
VAAPNRVMGADEDRSPRIRTASGMWMITRADRLASTICDMSRKGRQDQAGSNVWLSRSQLRTWLAFMGVQQRLGYEMNRQLQADSELSLADYDVLNALSAVEGGCLQVSALAATIGWERSRVSHHTKRMQSRGLVHCDVAASDRRATEVRLTPDGQQWISRHSPSTKLVSALRRRRPPAGPEAGDIAIDVEDDRPVQRSVQQNFTGCVT